MSACRITETIWADLNLFMYYLQPDCQKEWTLCPESPCRDWQHLPAPAHYTDALSGDDRVLPLSRVTP